MTQHAIPFHFLRGGTSRGPYFTASDLPQDRDHLAEVLIAAVGAGHPLNIDGIGGGNAVTTKVAILSPSSEPDVDVDYLFAQVSVLEREVDFSPTCGNILVGVGPAALEKGLIPAQTGETSVRIRAVNTGALVEALVQTPGGRVSYDGSTVIDGVPGSAAPVALNFLDVVGSRTGALFPTGLAQEEINGISVSLVDVAMPMMIARADSFGLSGNESREALDAMPELFAQMEPIRLEAGRRMGLGDVTRSVVPKIGLISAPQGVGHVSVRYFMPWQAHPTVAVTGAQCIAACALAPGTVADGLARPVSDAPATMGIEHPMGTLDVRVQFSRAPEFRFHSAGLTRTARLLARGEVMVPSAVWTGT